MNNHIIITPEQAEQIKGRYGKYSAIEPVPTPDGQFIVPENCLNDDDLQVVKTTLQALVTADNVQDIIDIPKEGEPVEGGRLYLYDSMFSELVKAVTDHTRMHFPPEKTPTLFTFFREEIEGQILEWIPNEYVKPGEKRTYNVTIYEVAAASEFMTVEGQTPDVTASVWQKWYDPNAIEQWHPYDGTASSLYQTGEKCTFNGHIWESKIDNNSWSPADYPAGWNDLGAI